MNENLIFIDGEYRTIEEAECIAKGETFIPCPTEEEMANNTLMDYIVQLMAEINELKGV